MNYRKLSASIIQNCVTCQIEFNNSEMIKNHFKSSFHKFNIKRKVLNLSPISLVYFNKINNKIDDELNENNKMSIHCDICNKKFKNRNTYNNHIISKKHLRNIKKKSDKFKFKLNKKEHLDQIVMYGKYDCLICNYKDDKLENIISHLDNKHCFIIPDRECVINMFNLYRKLRNIIKVENSCLFCKKTFSNNNGLIQHILIKGHLKLSDDFYNEFYEYYDYRYFNIDFINRIKNKLKIRVDTLNNRIMYESKIFNLDSKINFSSLLIYNNLEKRIILSRDLKNKKDISRVSKNQRRKIEQNERNKNNKLIKEDL